MVRLNNYSIVLIVLLFFAIYADATFNLKYKLNKENIFNEVKTKYGVVRGRVADDGEYFAYLGVPYAAPPTGKNRFKAPNPPLPWDGILEANRTVRCPQRGEGDEDCLILNIFTPIDTVNEPLPVLVFIHGGAFITGTGPTKGVKPLIKQDIILITINYRLGALGFLCLGIEEAPGNAGLKDQVAALQWIQENVADFGGNPKKVTIYGMSAGATSVDLLVLSNLTNGLYRNAIAESASATPVWAIDPSPITTARNLAAALDFPVNSNDINTLLDHYLQVSHLKLSQVNNEYYRNLTDGSFGFVPCVEKDVLNSEPFLTKAPLNILLEGKYDTVPIMYIFATSEGLYLRSSQFYNDNWNKKMEQNFIDFVPADLKFETVEIQKEIANNIRFFYFGDKTIGDDTLMEYLNYIGDSLILHGLLNSAELHARNKIQVYLMEFAYKGKMGNSDPIFDGLNVAGHGDASKYAILNKAIEDEADKTVIERVSTIIANFVKYSNPIPKETSLLPIVWPLVTTKNITYLHMDKDLNLYENPYWERKVFWDQLYAKFRRPILPVDPKENIV